MLWRWEYLSLVTSALLQSITPLKKLIFALLSLLTKMCCWRWCRRGSSGSTAAENEGPRPSSAHSHPNVTTGPKSRTSGLQSRSTPPRRKIGVSAETNPGPAPGLLDTRDSARISLDPAPNSTPQSPCSNDVPKSLGPTGTQSPLFHGSSPRYQPTPQVFDHSQVPAGRIFHPRELRNSARISLNSIPDLESQGSDQGRISPDSAQSIKSHERTPTSGGVNECPISQEPDTSHLDSPQNQASHGDVTAPQNSNQNRKSEMSGPGPTDSYSTEDQVSRESGATSHDPDRDQTPYGRNLTSSRKDRITPGLTLDLALGRSSQRFDLGHRGPSTSPKFSNPPARLSLGHPPDPINSEGPIPPSPYSIPDLVSQVPTHNLGPSEDSTPVSPDFARILETPHSTPTFPGFSHSPKIQGNTRDRASVGEIYPAGPTPKTPDFATGLETLHSGLNFSGAPYSPKTSDFTQSQVSQGIASQETYHGNAVPKARGATRGPGSKNPFPTIAPSGGAAPAPPGLAPGVVSKSSPQELIRRGLGLASHSSLQALRNLSLSSESGTPGAEQQYGLSVLSDGTNPDVEYVLP